VVVGDVEVTASAGGRRVIPDGTELR
jgi:hypothetical protein